MRHSGKTMVRANGVDLCVETFGDRTDPALLLIGGASASMDWWDDDFCVRLSAGPRYVIRYDLRDTGQSVSYPAGSPGYSGGDLAADAVALLDAFGIARGHLVGISMGGGLAQLIGWRYPDRLASLTLMSTSPIGSGVPDLPPPVDRLHGHFADPLPMPDWTDRAAVIDYIVADQQPYLGSWRDADPEGHDAALRELAGRVFDRTRDMAASFTNHSVLRDDDESVHPRLSEITAPTLVLHGTEDPLFPYAHAEALARLIPHATLVPLPGVGHEVPPRPLWDTAIPAILKHTT